VGGGPPNAAAQSGVMSTSKLAPPTGVTRIVGGRSLRGRFTCVVDPSGMLSTTPARSGRETRNSSATAGTPNASHSTSTSTVTMRRVLLRRRSSSRLRRARDVKPMTATAD
jgi:hypothetical protein